MKTRSFLTALTFLLGFALILSPIVAVAQSSLDGKARSDGEAYALGEWDVALNASLSPYSDSSRFGVRNGATDGFDVDYDEVEPPSPPVGLRTYFWYPNNPIDLRRLQTSMIPPTDDMNWTYRVESIGLDGTVVVNWTAQAVAAIPSELAVLLLDTAGAMVANMRETTTYNFSATADTMYTFAVNVVSAQAHDIATIGVSTFKTVVGKGYSLHSNVTFENQGNFTETFNAAFRANGTPASIFGNITLTKGNEVTVVITWNTSGFGFGNYLMSVVADVVLGELDIADNTLIDRSHSLTGPKDIRCPATLITLDGIICRTESHGCN